MGQVIFLDADDDVASVRVRLDAVGQESAAIVIPADNHALRSPIAMRLVARFADEIALYLCVISGDSLFRRLAQQEGMPAFSTIASYRRFDDNRRRGRFSLSIFTLASRRLIGTFFGVALVLAFAGTLVGLGYVLLPQATVSLSPATFEVRDAFQFTADAGVRGLDPEGKRIPARSITLTIEASDQAPVTGQQNTFGGRAEGQVTFKNRTNQAITIPGGTLVSTAAGVRFVTLGQVALPAIEGSTVRASVTATDPGERGNVARLEINRLEGALASQVSVLNEEPTIGGGVSSITVVSGQDQQQLREKLLTQMENEARAQLKVQLQEGEVLPDPSIRFVIMGEEFDHKVGDEARTLGLHIKATASGLVFQQQDVVDLVKRGWHPTLEEGFFIDNRTLEVGDFDPIEARGTVAVMKLPVRAIAVARVDAERAVDAVRWQPASHAAATLAQTFQLARPPQVRLEPGWASRALRVHVTVESPPAASKGQ